MCKTTSRHIVHRVADYGDDVKLRFVRDIVDAYIPVGCAGETTLFLVVNGVQRVGEVTRTGLDLHECNAVVLDGYEVQLNPAYHDVFAPYRISLLEKILTGEPFARYA